MRCDAAPWETKGLSLSFNPHTYMRCDTAAGVTITQAKVSIHTPTWGVTLQLRSRGAAHHVSIHTPTWGVTTCPSSVVLITRSFNPHTYMRCDRLMLFVDFNPVKFQSTHLHEVWRRIRGRYTVPASFNPHTYMRCDCWRDGSCSGNLVSIHTPTWGVTPCLVRINVLSDVSIHTPTWGVTTRCSAICQFRKFQSTHLHEVWLLYPLPLVH